MNGRREKARQGGWNGGVAKYLGIDPKIVRLLCLALIAAYGSGLLVYIIFAIFVPKEPK